MDLIQLAASFMFFVVWAIIGQIVVVSQPQPAVWTSEAAPTPAPTEEIARDSVAQV